jgi:hypothetical protein
MMFICLTNVREDVPNLSSLATISGKQFERALTSYAYQKALDLCIDGEKKEQLLDKIRSLGLETKRLPEK